MIALEGGNSMDIKAAIITKAGLARKAAKKMALLSTDTKNKSLIAMADALVQRKEEILQANSKDMENGRLKGLTQSLLDRLQLTEKRICDMAEGLRQVAALPDPVGEVLKMWKRPNGLQIGQQRVPLGVIGIIYEARPNVTVDAAALCLKAGNTVLLRGGSEALHSNKAVVDVISKAGTENGLPEDCIQFIDITDREAVNVMLKLNGYLDVLIPRGGAGLIRTVVENATVPVIETGVGNCHVYVHEDADLEMAEKIIINAKIQRPAVCNAIETILVHKNLANKFLPQVSKTLLEHGVELRGCPDSCKIVKEMKPAKNEDWSTEYLDLILAVKIVDSFEAALQHIEEYGTKHSEAIITKDYFIAQRFLKEVDAAAVYVNASTRFTDGFEFGFGAEIGISTQKLHARGPMGLTELTTIKYLIYGEGQIRK